MLKLALKVRWWQDSGNELTEWAKLIPKTRRGTAGGRSEWLVDCGAKSEMGDTWREELNGKMIEDSTICTSLTVGGRVDGSYT